jgi:O-antigen/teichoic acid export membrane protein
LKRNIAANYAGRAYSVLAIYLFVPAYLRILGVEAYGLISFYTIILTIASLADVGLSSTFAREAARTGDKKGLRDVLTTFERMLIISVGVFALALFLGSDWIAVHWLNKGTDISEVQMANCLKLMACMLPPQIAMALYTAGLLGIQRQVLANGLQAALTTVRAGLVIVPIYFRPEPEVFFAWQLGFTILFAIFVRFSLLRAIGHSGWSLGVFAFERIRPLLAFAGGMVAISVIASLNTQLDKIIVSKMFTVETFGFYSLASTLAQLPATATAPMIIGLLPKFTQLQASNEREAMRRLYEKYCYIIALLSGIGGMGLILFAREILALWLYGVPVKPEVVAVTQIMSMGGIFLAISSMPFYLGMAHGHNKTSVILGVFTTLVIVPLLIWATGFYGLPGAALPWVFLNGASLLVLSVIIHARFYPASRVRWWTHYTLLPLSIAVTGIGLARIMASQLSTSPLWTCFIAAIFGLAAMALAAIAYSRNWFALAGTLEPAP